MNNDQTITVTIDPMGRSTIEANGFQGEGCVDKTKPIEDALQGAAAQVDRVYKPEWSNPNEEVQEQGQQIGFN